MRTLFFIVMAAALGWSGYWWVGSTAQKAALSGWLAQQEAQGWVAQAATVTVTGYPNRFDAILDQLDLADPYSGWAWSAPQFQILALSYQPNHIIAVWPERQTVSTPLETLDVVSDRLRGSVRFAPDTGLALQEAILEIEGMAIASTAEWTAGMTGGQLSIRRSGPGISPDFGYEVDFRAEDVKLPEPVKAALDPTGLLPDRLTPILLRMTPVYDAPWDRAAVEGATPELTAVNIQNLSVTWGRLDLRVRGTLTVDRQGLAEGDLNVVARNWQDMLSLGVRAGWIGADFARNVERGLTLVAQVTGQTDTLDVPLTFRDGQARLGPIPIGRAPALVYRQ